MVRGIFTSTSPGLSLLRALSAYVQVVSIRGGRDATVNWHPEPARPVYFSFSFCFLFTLHAEYCSLKAYSSLEMEVGIH